MSERDCPSGIPSGWTYEPMVGMRNFAVIKGPDGFVSLDFERRLFRGGWTTIGRPASTEKYTGRGWKSRLVTDAVKWLQQVYEDRAERRERNR